MIDALPRPTGRVVLRIYRDGVLERVDEGENLVLDAALPALIAALGNRITQVGFGTAGNAAAPGDTALTGAFAKAVSAVTFPTPKTIQVAFTLLGTEANGVSIQELGLLDAGGILLARRTRAPLYKTPDLSIDGTWTLAYP